MPPKSDPTFGYKGPLKLVISPELGPNVGQLYIHAARVKLGAAIARADMVEGIGAGNITKWYSYPKDNVTIKVGRFGDLHFAEILPLHPRESLPEVPTPGLWPWGGMLRDSYYKVEEVPVGADKVYLPVVDSYIPNPESLTTLDSEYKSLVKWLEKNASADPPPPVKKIAEVKLLRDNTHNKADSGLRQTPHLALTVPYNWAHLYNNPVQPAFDSLIPPKVFAQHRLIKPTMYSGRMRVVAQLLMGYGTKTPLSAEDIELIQELSLVPQNERVVEDYQRDESEKELGLMNYWFHWFKTHGIYKTPNKRYYLIEISEGGVYAMRLPMMPKENGMPEELAEYLPSLPLGFNFPRRSLTPADTEAGMTKSPFDRAVDDGWVFKVIDREDMAPFYEKLSPSYAECGWAFNMTGNKMDNVGFRLAGPRPFDYPVFEHWNITIQGGDGQGESPWDYQHFDGGYDKSINTLSGSIELKNKGSAVNVAVYAQNFKVPDIDPLTGVPGVVSFSMLPQQWPTDGRPPPPDYAAAWRSYPVCDTVVHVFYDEDELVWLKFYNAGAKRREIATSNGSMPGTIELLLGSASWGSSSSFTAPPAGFYSNRIDPRNTEGSSYMNAMSQGRKIWSSPYMGVEYSWPYPPFHFGYEQSNSETEWFNEFNPSYRSVAGRPWTAKRHAYHVHVTGSAYTGQSYSYGSAIPLTDRECVFICERNVKATSRTIDYQYAAMLMQFVYATYPSWVPDPAIWDKGIVPVGAWEEWQLRDDTVKYLQWMYLPEEEGEGVTGETRQQPRTVLNIQNGTFTAPVVTWNNGVSKTNEETYKVVTICSSLGGEYPLEMKASPGADQFWINTLPDPDPNGFKIAHLWCTRSVLGRPGFKQNIYLNGAMNYTGVFFDRMNADDRRGRFQQITYVGVS